MHTFTIRVQFSDEIAANAFDVATRDGDAAADAYLERMLDKALDGGHFEHVEVELIQP